MVVQQCFLLLKTSKKYSKLFFKFIICNRIIKTMEHQKMLNILNKTNDSKFVTRKWNIDNDNSKATYDVRN